MRPPLVRLLLALVLGTVAATAVLTINRSWLTPGAHRDSVHYLSAAESLVEDGTLRVPVAHWSSGDSTSVLAHYPPGFPALISIPMRWGVRAHPAALWTMAASAAVAMAFAFLLAAHAFGPTAGVLAAVMLLCTPALTRLSLAVWSEPSFLAVTMPLLWCMVRRPRWHLAHGLLAFAALAVRYVGVAGSLAATLWALSAEGTWKQRLGRGALAAGPSLGFLVWWQHYVSARDGAIRRLGVYADLGRNMPEVAAMLRGWLAPGSWGGGAWTAAWVLIGASLLLWRAWQMGAVREPEQRRVWQVAALYGTLYAAVVVASRLFMDAAIPFDERLAIPLLVLATVLVAGALLHGIGHIRLPMKFVFTGIVGWWCISGWNEIRTGVEVVNALGRFYTHQSWIADPVVRWVDDHSHPYQVLYSNEAELIHYHTGRHARQAPVQGEDLAKFAERFRAAPSALIVIEPLHIEDVPRADLARKLGLVAVASSPRATVFVAH